MIITVMASVQKAIASGRGFVADLDLVKFFDRVRYDRLISRLASWIMDGRILLLIPSGGLVLQH